MSDASPALLIGNNLAVLVAADELARRGRSVTLLTDGKTPGGHFAGTRLQGHEFDVGMVQLEKPASGRVEEAWGPEYRPSMRNDWTRFSGEVAGWLERQVPLRRAPTPTVQVEGRTGPDYLIANRLDLLRAVAADPPEPLARSDPRHAIHKNSGTAYDTLSYADAATLHHGEDWHNRYIEPFVRKLFGVSSREFLARFHRAGWVPLYYPDTLTAALRGEPATLPEYAFHTTDTGFVGLITARMLETLSQAPHVAVVDTPLTSLSRAAGAWQASCAGTTWTSSRVGLGLPADRCRALLGLPSLAQPAAASVAIMFCLVRADAIGRNLACHMIIDGELATYRLTDQDALAGLDPPWHRVVIEASPQQLERLAGSPGDDAAQAVLLIEMQTLLALRDEESARVLKYVVARNALVIPTYETVARSSAAHAELASLAPDALLTGALLGFGSASFNEQIVQGLHTARDMT